LTFKEILELIEKVAEYGIASIEIERAGTKVRIEGKVSRPQVIHSIVGEAKSETQMLSSAPPLDKLGGHVLPQAGEGAESEAGLHVITSPIVGTFYRSPNPESDVFVNVGDRITNGKVLCIIEAMKLMNEIESDVEGVLAKIYPANGQPVEYGEKLFAVRT
jgi:acetyl-CoA carboxylase biotin carboxyl carrier protein